MYAKWYLSCGAFLVVAEDDDDGRRRVESESVNTILVLFGFSVRVSVGNSNLLVNLLSSFSVHIFKGDKHLLYCNLQLIIDST